MPHQLTAVHVNDINVDFFCSVCERVIGFNKPGVGDPAAIQNGDETWSPPENPEQWMGPCEE